MIKWISNKFRFISRRNGAIHAADLIGEYLGSEYKPTEPNYRRYYSYLRFEDDRVIIIKRKNHTNFASVDIKLHGEVIRVLEGEGTHHGISSFRDGCWVDYLKTVSARAEAERTRRYVASCQAEKLKWTPVEDCDD